MKISNKQNSLSGNVAVNVGIYFRSFVFCVSVIAGIILDQWVKYLIFSRTVLPGPLVQFRNYYFAFSIRLPVWAIFVLYTCILSVAAWHFVRQFSHAKILELGGWIFLFAGALSNVGERIVLGYVRDYFLVLNGIFNLADLFIIVGILLLLVKPRDQKSHDTN